MSGAVKWKIAYFANGPCGTNNKNPQTNIGVQVEDQKSKAAKPLESSQLY